MFVNKQFFDQLIHVNNAKYRGGNKRECCIFSPDFVPGETVLWYTSAGVGIQATPRHAAFTADRAAACCLLRRSHSRECCHEPFGTEFFVEPLELLSFVRATSAIMWVSDGTKRQFGKSLQCHFLALQIPCFGKIEVPIAQLCYVMISTSQTS